MPEAGDAGSKELFETLLGDEEKHADFLEAQLHSIKEMGIGVYLSQQMGKSGLCRELQGMCRAGRY